MKYFLLEVPYCIVGRQKHGVPICDPTIKIVPNKQSNNTTYSYTANMPSSSSPKPTQAPTSSVTNTTISINKTTEERGK